MSNPYNKIKDKIALVVGASAGIGYGITEKLADEGFIVHVGARRTNKMDPLKKKGVFIHYIDVQDEDSIQTAVSDIMKRHGRLDLVISNAGYATYGPIEDVTMENIKNQFDVNVFGMARVNKAVLPIFRKQNYGRLIMTASAVSNMANAGIGWYAATKHAIHGMTIALRQELMRTDIDVILIKPGAVKSEFDTIAMASLRNCQTSDEYKVLMQGLDITFTDTFKRTAGPEKTVKEIYKAVTDKRPKYQYITTTDAKFLLGMLKVLPQKAFDRMMVSTFEKNIRK